LDNGEGLNEEQLREVLRLPDAAIEDLLALAHEVRVKWCGEAVEVEGIISLKTGGCPEDCHFCSQSGRFTSPVRAVWLDIASWWRPPKRQPRPALQSSALSLQCAARTSG
jgi:biotin synthase